MKIKVNMVVDGMIEAKNTAIEQKAVNESCENQEGKEGGKREER